MKDAAGFLKNKRVALVYGGFSSERKVALMAVPAVEEALKALKLKYIKFDLNEKSRKKVFTFIEKEKIDVVFLMLHGKFGEDGTIQGGLDLMGVPYIGSGTLASAVAVDKAVSKIIMLQKGIPTPAFETLRRGETAKMHPPVVIKPVDGGSTIGIAIVKKKSALKKALKDAFKYSETVISEKYVSGTEITVPVFEDRALEIIEIIPKTSFYDYEAKYAKGMSEHIIPARLDRKTYRKAQALAEKVHRDLGLSSFSRVDIIVGRNGRLNVLEVNNLPGLTGTSLLPEAAKLAGIDFKALVAKMLHGAFRKNV